MSTGIEVEVEVSCSGCGEILDIEDSNGPSERLKRTYATIMVKPCERCLQDARDAGIKEAQP